LGVTRGRIASLAAGAAAGAIAGGLAALALAIIYPEGSRSSFEFGLLYTVTRLDQALSLIGLGLAIAMLPPRLHIAGLVMFVVGIPAGGLGSDSIVGVLRESPWLISGVFLVAPVCCAIVGASLVAPRSVALALTPLAALVSGVALGLVISFNDPSAAHRSFVRGAVLAGLWLALPPLVLWRRFHRPWFPITGRIFGAWLIAIGAMLTASQLIPRPAPSETDTGLRQQFEPPD
jgi:hypothetical protein